MSDSRQLLITLGLNTDSFTTNMKRANDLLKESKTEFQRVSEVSEVLEKSLEGLGVKQQFLTENLDILNAKSQLYADRIEETKNALDQEKTAFNELGLKIKELVGDNEDLSKLNEEQAKELKGLQQQYDKSEKAITKYNKRLLDTQSSYNMVRKEIASTMKDIQECSFDMDKFANTQKIDALKESISTISRDFERSKLSLEDFGKTYESIGVIQENFNMRLKDHNEIMKISEREMEKLDAETVTYKDKIEELKSSISRLKSEQQNYTDTSEKSTQMYKTLENEIAELESEQAKYVRLVEVSEERMKELNSTYQTSEMETLKLKRSSKELSEQLKELVKNATDLSILDKEIQSLSDVAIKDLNEKLKELDGRFKILSASSKSFGKNEQSLKESISIYNDKLKLSTELMNAYNLKVLQTEEKVKSLTLQEKELANAIRKGKEELSGFEGKEFDSRKKEVDELEESYKKLTEQLEKEKGVLKENSDNFVRMQVEVGKLKRDIDEANISFRKFGANDKIRICSEELEVLKQKFETLGTKIEFATTRSSIFGVKLGQVNKTFALQKQRVEVARETFDRYEVQLSATQNKLTTLKTAQELLNEKIEKTKLELKEVEAETGKTSERYVQLKASLMSLDEQYEKLNSEMRATEKSAEELKNKMMETATSIREVTKSAEGGRLGLVQSQFRNLGKTISGVGDKLKNTGYQFQMLSMVSTMALGAIIKSGAEYEQSMANLSAVLGIDKTSEAYKKLDETSMEWSKHSIFSAKEVSEGLLQIAQNGFDTTQSIGMLKTELLGAQAGGMKLEQATELSISALDTMGHRGKDALQYLPRMMNDVAITANKSSGNIKDLLEAINQGGGLADQFHISIEQLCTMFGILANQGLKGERAGRSLNSVLINLTKSSGQSAHAMATLSERIGLKHNLMYDAKGKLLPITEGLGRLRRALNGLSEEKKLDLLSSIGGKTQIRAFLTLLNHMTDANGHLSKSYEDLYKELNDPKNVNALKEMSDKMSNTFEGQFKMFKARISSVAIDIFKTLKPTLTSLLKTVNGLLVKFDGWLNKLTPKQKKMFSEALIFCVTVAPLLIGLGTGVKLIGFAIGGLLTPIRFATDAFKLLFSSKRIVETAKELEKTGKELTSLQKKAKAFEKFKSIFRAIFTGIGKIGKVIGKLGLAIVKSVGKITLAIGKSVGKILLQIPKAISTIGGILSKFGGKILEFVVGMPGKILGIISKIKEVVKAIGLVEKAMAILDFVMDLNPIILAISAVIVILGVLSYEVYKHWNKIKPYFDKAKKKMGELADYIGKEFSKIGKHIGNFYNRLAPFIGGMLYGTLGNMKAIIGTQIRGMADQCKGIGDMIIGVFSLNGKKIKQGFKEFVSSSISLLTNPLHIINWWIGEFNATMRLFGSKYHIKLLDIKKINEDLSKNFYKVCHSIENDFKQIPKNISKSWKQFKVDMADWWSSTKSWWANNLSYAKNGITSWWSGVKKNTKTSFDQMCSELSQSWSNTKSWWSGNLSSAGSSISSWWNGVKSNSKTSFDQMCSEIGQSWSNAKNWWSGICSSWSSSFSSWWGGLKATNSRNASDMWSELSRSMSNAIPYLENGARSIGNSIRDELRKLPSQLYNIGAEMMDSLFNGIKSMGNRVSNWISNHVSDWKQDFGDFGNIFMALPNRNHNIEKHNTNRSFMPTMLFAIPQTEKAPKVSSRNRGFSQIGFASFDPISNYMSNLRKSITSSFEISNFQTNGSFYKPQKIESSASESNNEIIETLIKNQNLIISLLSKSDKVTNINFSVGSRNVAQACYDEFGRIIEKEQSSRNIAKGWR